MGPVQAMLSQPFSRVQQFTAVVSVHTSYDRLFKVCFIQQFAMGMTILNNENDICFHY